MTPVESTQSPFGDGRLSEAIVNPDGTWTALNAEGKPIQFVDFDDFEVIDALLRERPWEKETR